MGADTINEDHGNDGPDRTTRHHEYQRDNDAVTALTYQYGLRTGRADMPDFTSLSPEVQAILNQK